jgi:hypothetical protein
MPENAVRHIEVVGRDVVAAAIQANATGKVASDEIHIELRRRAVQDFGDRTVGERIVRDVIDQSIFEQADTGVDGQFERVFARCGRQVGEARAANHHVAWVIVEIMVGTDTQADTCTIADSYAVDRQIRSRGTFGLGQVQRAAGKIDHRVVWIGATHGAVHVGVAPADRRRRDEIVTRRADRVGALPKTDVQIDAGTFIACRQHVS